MSALVKVLWSLRRVARSGWALFVALVVGGAVQFEVFQPDFESGPTYWLALGVPWGGALGARVYRRLYSKGAGRETKRTDLDLGVLLLVAGQAWIQYTGGLTSPYDAMPYILVAFLASFAVNPIGWVLVGVALGLEALAYFGVGGEEAWRPFLIRSGFLVGFACLSWFFTRVEIARVRERSRRERDREKERTKEETRLFRLVAAPSRDGVTDEERLYQSSVDEVHHHLYHTLDLLRTALGLHTAVLMLLDDAGEKLSIAELVTDFTGTAEGPFRSADGAVAAVTKRGQTVNLQNLKPGYGGLCYYRDPAPVRAFLGVPVLERGKLLGALCVDRVEDRPFSESEEALLMSATRQILRALENERVFVQLERSKREQTILHQASQALGGALDEEAVVEAGLASAEEIVAHDFAAITYYDSASRRHVVRRAVGQDAARFSALTFRDNASLTAMAVKNRHYLPYRGDFDGKQQVVYTRRANLRGMQSLLILPLVVREDAIGTLALATERPNAFGQSVRGTLQVLANQLAVSLANAESVRRLEEMASTDGLTGCLNKRAFLEEMQRKIRSAERFNRKLSLIVTDLDHFKSVNDTYGHATGDVVLKELGAILHRMKRETDAVARFGGEEFCVLCEETDTEGAIHLAERVREAMSQTIFQTEQGPLQITCSLGVATYPQDANTEDALFDRADKALYAAKHKGRDQVCTASEPRAA